MVGQEPKKFTVRLTANFERNLDEIDAFLTEAEAPRAFDELLDDLTETVIPNLERFPAMGRVFLSHSVRSVEASNGIDTLRKKLLKLGEDAEIREYVLAHYLVLYVCADAVIHLLSIRHHRQLSFDFQHLWSAN